MTHEEQQNILSVRDTLLAWADDARLSLKFATADNEEPFRNQVANYQTLADKLDRIAGSDQ